jgi:hypothetical protein
MIPQHLVKRRKTTMFSSRVLSFIHFIQEADPQSVNIEMYHKLLTYIYAYVYRLEFRKL